LFIHILFLLYLGGWGFRFPAEKSDISIRGGIPDSLGIVLQKRSLHGIGYKAELDEVALAGMGYSAIAVVVCFSDSDVEVVEPYPGFEFIDTAEYYCECLTTGVDLLPVTDAECTGITVRVTVAEQATVELVLIICVLVLETAIE
jgi:hypothetical protein